MESNLMAGKKKKKKKNEQLTDNFKKYHRISGTFFTEIHSAGIFARIIRR